MKKTTYLYLLCSILIVSFYACSKERPETLLAKNTLGLNTLSPTDSNGLRGIYILCNDQVIVYSSSIAYYDFATGTFDRNYFQHVNGYDLGINATDMERYGNKIYVTLKGNYDGWYNSYVEVLDANTLVSLARIPFFTEGQTQYYPTNVAFANGKAFITCADGYIRRIDTSALTIDGSLFVGGEPIESAVAGNKLFVCAFPDPNTVSTIYPMPVIDIPSFTKDTDIVSGNMPVVTKTGADGNLYVHYTTLMVDTIYRPAYFAKIDPQTLTVTNLNYSAYVFDMAIRGDSLLLIEPYYRTLNIYNTATGAWSSLSYEGDFRFTPTAIEINKHNGDFAILDSEDWGAWEYGEFFYYNKDGVKLFSYQIDKDPMEIMFLYK